MTLPTYALLAKTILRQCGNHKILHFPEVIKLWSFLINVPSIYITINDSLLCSFISKRMMCTTSGGRAHGSSLHFGKLSPLHYYASFVSFGPHPRIQQGKKFEFCTLN